MGRGGRDLDAVADGTGGSGQRGIENLTQLKMNAYTAAVTQYQPELALLAQESKAIVMRSMVTVPLARFDSLLPTSNNQVSSRTFIAGGGF